MLTDRGGPSWLEEGNLKVVIVASPFSEVFMQFAAEKREERAAAVGPRLQVDGLEIRGLYNSKRVSSVEFREKNSVERARDVIPHSSAARHIHGEKAFLLGVFGAHLPEVGADLLRRSSAINEPERHAVVGVDRLQGGNLSVEVGDRLDVRPLLLRLVGLHPISGEAPPRLETFPSKWKTLSIFDLSF